VLPKTDHTCDTTVVELEIAEQGGAKRVWSLTRDVLTDPLQGNPHADGHGNAEVWHFYDMAGSKMPSAEAPAGSAIKGERVPDGPATPADRPKPDAASGKTPAEPRDAAIARGVAYLKSIQQVDGTWPYDQIGPTALAGLTLLECGVPANDAAVVKAAGAVRQAALTATQTYSLALSILFLDRLGEAADVFLIESMTVRLLAGQNSHGGWTYECPSVSDQEVRRLTTLLRQRNELVAAKDLPKAGVRRTEKDLPQEIQQQLAQIKKAAAAANGGSDHPDDNSNTQFAVLGLWVAHRHGLPVGTALSRINTRFRASQAPDGGWGYKYYPTNTGAVRVRALSTATMTCSGLLGLGVSQGYTNEIRDVEKVKPKNDPTKKDIVIRNGLLALGSCIDHPLSAQKGGPRDIRLLDGGKGREFYFLWSLERVAVAYELKTIGGKDWYAWGCEILLARQERDGSWQAKFAEAGCDTCFALLFLRRANLAKDLSAALTGVVQDPGEVGLKGIGLKPPEPGDKKDDESGGAGSRKNGPR
jgi:hypothetical protein